MMGYRGPMEEPNSKAALYPLHTKLCALNAESRLFGKQHLLSHFVVCLSDRPVSTELL